MTTIPPVSPRHRRRSSTNDLEEHNGHDHRASSDHPAEAAHDRANFYSPADNVYVNVAAGADEKQERPRPRDIPQGLHKRQGEDESNVRKVAEDSSVTFRTLDSSDGSVVVGGVEETPPEERRDMLRSELVEERLAGDDLLRKEETPPEKLRAEYVSHPYSSPRTKIRREGGGLGGGGEEGWRGGREGGRDPYFSSCYFSPWTRIRMTNIVSA